MYKNRFGWILISTVLLALTSCAKQHFYSLEMSDVACVVNDKEVNVWINENGKITQTFEMPSHSAYSYLDSTKILFADIGSASNGYVLQFGISDLANQDKFYPNSEIKINEDVTNPSMTIRMDRYSDSLYCVFVHSNNKGVVTNDILNSTSYFFDDDYYDGEIIWLRLNQNAGIEKIKSLQVQSSVLCLKQLIEFPFVYRDGNLNLSQPFIAKINGKQKFYRNALVEFGDDSLRFLNSPTFINYSALEKTQIIIEKDKIIYKSPKDTISYPFDTNNHELSGFGSIGKQGAYFYASRSISVGTKRNYGFYVDFKKRRITQAPVQWGYDISLECECLSSN